MRVLMTTDTLGGVWTYALELARALKPHDVEIALATMGHPLSPAQHDEVAELHHVELFESTYKLEWMRDPWEDVDAAGEWLRRIAEEFCPDLVHLNDYSHAALDWHVPVVVVGHSCVYSWFQGVRQEMPGSEWNVYRERVTRGLQSADLVIAPTQAMLGCLQFFYGPLEATQVIHNARAMPRYSRRNREAFILSAGRIWDEGKNVALLASIAKKVPWPIHVAGENRHPDGDGALTADEIRFLGQVPQQEMPALYSRASIYALPAKYEPFGLTPLEAALCGCPLVLGDIATLREVWQDAAVYVDPESRSGWKKTLKRVIFDSAWRSELAGKARHRAQEFSTRNMARDYLATYTAQVETHRLRTGIASEARVGEVV